MPVTTDGRGVRTVIDQTPAPADPAAIARAADRARLETLGTEGGRKAEEARRSRLAGTAGMLKAKGIAAARPFDEEPVASALERRDELKAAADALVVARPNRVGEKRSPEARARMAAAQRARAERRRAAQGAPTEPSVPVVESETAGPPPVVELALKGRPFAVLPCGDCSHVVVCRLRPELEAWAEDVVPPVVPFAAISIDALSVRCEYFLEATS